MNASTPDTPPFELPRPDLGPWRAGNTGTEGVWRFEAAEPGRDVLVTALVHGNELCGAWALLALLNAGLRPRRGALTLAFCNLEAFDRFDPADYLRSRFVDQDMNRVWGTMPWRGDGGLSSEQRRALELLPFVDRADWLLDLHSMHDAGPPLVLTGLRPRNIALARRLGVPGLAVVDAGHAEGRRMRDHGRFDDPRADDCCALLIECGFHGDPAARVVAVDMVARFLVAAGTVDADDVPGHWLQPPPPVQRTLRVTEAVTVAVGEPPRFAHAWVTGDRIAAEGTLIGFNGGEPFFTPYPYCTLIMPLKRQPRPGLTLVRLARDENA